MRKFLFKTTLAVSKWILLKLQHPDDIIEVDDVDEVYEIDDTIDMERTPCPNCENPALKSIVGYDPLEVYFLCGSVIILNKEDKKIDKFIAGDECLIMGDKLIDITRGIEH